VLQRRIDVAEEDVLRLAEGVGDLGWKSANTPSASRACRGSSGRSGTSRPRRSSRPSTFWMPVRSAPALGEEVELAHGIVVPDHAHHLDRLEERRGGGEVHGGASDDPVGLAERGLDGIEGYATYTENRHVESDNTCSGTRNGECSGHAARRPSRTTAADASSFRHVHGLRGPCASGPSMPNTVSPLRSTIRTARASASRALHGGRSSTSTASSGFRVGFPAWYQEFAAPAVCSR
jgi:hypothetical protein